MQIKLGIFTEDIEKMNRRSIIYSLLLVFVAFGVIADWVIWVQILPTSSQNLNDLSQVIGVVILCRYWQNADSDQLGICQSGVSKLFTILLPPVGMAIYLFQSRIAKKAVTAFLAFWAGLIFSIYITFYAVDLLVT